jgi:hypothetical protein
MNQACYIVNSPHGPARARTLESAARMREILGGHITFGHATECPECGAVNPETETRLGTLGTVEWYRCRACGMVYGGPK